jgi:hypothetical protein
MGPQRDGVWRERGITEKFSTNGPPVLWRASVNRGYCGPAVAVGRLYTLDREQGPVPERKPGVRSLPVVPGNERVLCLDARDGSLIWERQFLKDFIDVPPVWGYAAHPLLDGDRLICTVGGSNSAVVAFHKDTGRERICISLTAKPA